MKELLDQLYEDIRCILINSDSLDATTSNIENQKVKLTIYEILRTIQADLLLLMEIIGDLSCSYEDDWGKIIDEHRYE